MTNQSEIMNKIATSLVKQAMDLGLVGPQVKSWVGKQLKHKTEAAKIATKAAIAIYG